MLDLVRSFRRGSIASLAALMLVIASIAGTTAPAAYADETTGAEAAVVEEGTEQESTDDVGAYAWKTAVASSYGPGLWGNRTACGQTLYRSTIGVAHRTMACGTRLKFKGRNGVIVNANVIDRGPYVSGRTFDLTQATVQAMGYADSYAFGVRSVEWDYR